MVQRSPNSHTLKTRAFPFITRLKREDVMRPADTAEWHAEADRIAGLDRWYSRAGWGRADLDCTLIGFATQAEADEMQQWIAASGIETRPAPPKYTGPMLAVGSYNKDGQEQN
ncbi:MAG: hypothetical protein JWR80_3855 [Bradyrhizobium sp.]|nr:hypothetical protein [Bradyrhizobium sp.]